MVSGRGPALPAADERSDRTLHLDPVWSTEENSKFNCALLHEKSFAIPREIMMRLLQVGFFVCCIATHLVAQCPIQPRQASLDGNGKNVTIRYYNSGVRSVRDVQFVLTEDTGLSGQSVLANFSAKGILHPKQERMAVFPNIGGMALSGNVEVEVKRVSFGDRSTWMAPRKNTCKVVFAAR